MFLERDLEDTGAEAGPFLRNSAQPIKTDQRVFENFTLWTASIQGERHLVFLIITKDIYHSHLLVSDSPFCWLTSWATCIGRNRVARSANIG
jgi:hypothetical protein